MDLFCKFIMSLILFQQGHMGVGQKSSPGSIQLIARDRVMMLVLFILQICFSFYYMLVFSHYISFPTPSLFSAPSLLASPYTQPAYLYNGLLYALFFVQHVVMALIIFKVKLSKIWRYIYNITSAITYIAIYYHARPLSGQSQILFTTPMWVNIPILMITFPLQMYTLYQFCAIIFVPYPLKQILTSKTLQPEDYTKQSITGLVTTGLYRFCRHPMQSSVIITTIFVSNVYTVDRIVFLLVNLAGVLVGIWYQEKRLMKKFKDYKDYQRKVPYKLIPYIF